MDHNEVWLLLSIQQEEVCVCESGIRCTRQGGHGLGQDVASFPSCARNEFPSLPPICRSLMPGRHLCIETQIC